jgi:TetR/AcrR family transcriptional repressor of nem operon
MSDQYEKSGSGLTPLNWATLSVLLQAQQENHPGRSDPEMLAENLISSFQGALLRSKVKKSAEPLNNFIHLYFDVFLAQREEN